MTKIVCIGECMVEMAPCAQAGTFQMGFAGDTMNTAWYLRQLMPASDQVDYLTAVGTDTVSDQMVAFLENAGIGTGRISRIPDRTVGLYMIQLSDGERSFNYWRGQSAARALAQEADQLAAALVGADIAYFSGITFAILPEADRDQFLDVLRDFRADGGQVAFDPNLRPRLWTDADEMTSAITQAATVSDIVLPSHEDETDWFGDVDPSATVTRYLEGGATTIVVKNGEGPILAWDNDAYHHFDPAPVRKVIDTTAAGDSFNAGFFASRVAGQSLEQSIRSGADLAAQVIQARGALVSGLV